jgi:ankyrin repeat protein
LSASALQADEVIHSLHHLSLVNCKFVNYFHRNGLLASILRRQLPNLHVLTLGGAVYEEPDPVSQTEYAELARLLVGRHIDDTTQKTSSAGDVRQEIIVEITYTHRPIVAFLREVGRELAARKHSVRFTFVDLSTDPLWALQALTKLPVVVKRAVFTTHPSKGRKSILHETAITADVDRVRWLIDNGAVLDAKDAFGCTPLMRAVEHNNVEIVDLLLAKGANVWVTNFNREGPVFYAALRGYTRLLNLLLRHVETREGLTGAALTEKLDTDCVDAKQFTPLHAAIIRQSEGCMRALLDVGCSPHKVNSHGQQAQHIATTVHFTAAVELLLSMGVDVNSVDAMGMTPLDYARRYKHRAKRVNVLRASLPAHPAEDSADSDEAKEAVEDATGQSGSSSEELEPALTPEAPQEPQPVPDAVDLENLIEAAGGVAGRRPTGKRRHSRKHQRGRTQSR